MIVETKTHESSPPQVTLDDKDDRLIRKGLRGWLTLYGIWAIPGLIMAGGYYYAQLGGEHDLGWWFAFLDYMTYFTLLATLCPPMYRLTGRFAFAPKRWPVTITAHLLTIFLLMAVVKVIWAIQRVFAGMSKETVWQAIIKDLTNARGYFGSLIVVVYYVVVVMAMILIRQHRRRMRQEERTRLLEMNFVRLQAQLNQSKLQTLKMQLQPHFLFNALNTISALVQCKENDRAYKTIAQLGDLLRSSLKLPNSSTIPLRKELEFIDKYLAIELLRFSDRLRTKIDVPEELLEAMVPALILQPLVENCIHHAAAAQLEPLLVTIAVSRQGTKLHMTVTDDGPGLPDHWSPEHNAGVGLGNARERLAVMYGDAGRIDLTSAHRRGTRAMVTIPYSVTSMESPEPFMEPRRDIAAYYDADVTSGPHLKPEHLHQHQQEQQREPEHEHRHSRHNR